MEPTQPTGPEPTAAITPPIQQLVNPVLPFGKHELDQYLNHVRHRNTIEITGTLLLECYQDARPYMEDIHRNVLVDVSNRSRYGQRLARTYHTQLAAVIRRYLPIIEDQLNQQYPMESPAYQDHLPAEQHVDTCDTYAESIGKDKREKLDRLKAAVDQAERLEQRAKDIVDATNEERARGNIEFVKDIRKAGVRQFR